ncbi:YfzA family protein [Solibacillus sp. FSL K6-1523]|uniref:YfzA family protein n=1 Tax=Solibacillus sp. FSL K6-1523 TaxID=2921471 RepID=UPI004046F758
MNRLIKKWIIHIGYFLILNIVFIIFDGTSLFTNFSFRNLGSFGNWIVQTGVFTEWLNFYKNPLFNVVVVFSIFHILITALYDVMFRVIIGR